MPGLPFFTCRLGRPVLTAAALVLQIAIAGPAVALPSHHALAPAGRTASVASGKIPRRTGLPEVDRVLDAADARRVDRLRDLVGSFKAGCVKKPLFGNTAYILCHPHESVRTPVPVIVVGYRNGCEGQYIGLGRARDALRGVRFRVAGGLCGVSPAKAARLRAAQHSLPDHIFVGGPAGRGDCTFGTRQLELFLSSCEATLERTLSYWPGVELLLDPPGEGKRESDAVLRRRIP